MSFLQIDNLRYAYPNSPNTKFQFDLNLDAGKILAVIGKSGSGKSTLLDLIAGFLPPERGEIVLNGARIETLPPAARQVAILFQKNNVFEHLTVLENVCLAISPNSAPNQAQRQSACEMLEKVELNGFENRRCANLSGGQMQRVALARELLRNCALFLLDEPFSGLDEETRAIMLPLLKQIVATKQRSIILVTHDLEGVSDIVDQAGEIRGGMYKLT